MKTHILKVAMLGMLALPLTSWAGGDSGFYVGGGVGNSTIKVDQKDTSGVNFNFDGNDAGYKVILGYNFGIIPLIDLGVEGSYVSFGKIEDTTINGPADAKATGFDGFGVGALTFGPFAVFGKMGMIRWSADTTLDGATSSDSGTDPAYGIGARFQLFSFSVRAEYELFDVEGLKDLSMFSVSALYTF
jgi:outer membrane immunogenic protein